MQARDFSNRKNFPGTHGTSFDQIVRVAAIVQSLPSPVYFLILFALAVPIGLTSPSRVLVLFAFFLTDYALVTALPHFGKSFGPPKPPVLLLALARIPFAILPDPFWLLAELAGTVLVIYGFWIEPHKLRLTRQKLYSPKLKLSRPLRVMHLGDPHVERVTQRERDLLGLVRAEEPDLILFSGDFLNLSYVDDPIAQDHAHEILSELHAPLGVFAVSGSPPVDSSSVVRKLLDGTGVRWLRDEKVSLKHEGQEIRVLGITCTHKPFLDRPRLEHLSDDVDHHENFTILLYHTPDLAPDSAELGVDLQLSGHTHGGQVRLPFYGALYTASLYGKSFESGRRQVGAMTLYVTRGIGLEGKGAPRVRFLCPPEAVLWEIGG